MTLRVPRARLPRASLADEAAWLHFLGISRSSVSNRPRPARLFCRSCGTASDGAATRNDDHGARIRITQLRRSDGLRIEFSATQSSRLMWLRRKGLFDGQNALGEHDSWKDSSTSAITRLLTTIFLPVNYPSSVASQYLQFAQATACQIVFSQVSKVLATQAMLLAVGVGEKGALPLAAVTAWILKDGLGHIGAVVFGTVVNTRFDSDPKRYRFQASVVGKLADILSIFTLGRPEYFLLLSALGGTCGRISTSLSTSCRAKIHETFALQNNLGDVLRCSTSQSTCAQLLGTAFGVCLGPVVGSDIYRVLALNGICSGLALYYAYVSSSIVRMASLNVQRTEQILFPVVDHIMLGVKCGEDNLLRHVPTVDAVRDLEEFVWPYRSVFPGAPLRVNPSLGGARLAVVTPESSLREAKHMLGVELRGRADQSGEDARVVTAPPARSWWPFRGITPFESRQNQAFANGWPVASVALWLHAGASSQAVVSGFFHACLFRRLLADTPDIASAGSHPSREICEAELSRIFEHSESLHERWWPYVAEAMAAHGWNLDAVFLDVKEARVKIS